MEGHLIVNHQLLIEFTLFPLQGKQALMLQYPLTASYSMPLTAPTSHFLQQKYRCRDASAIVPLGGPLNRTEGVELTTAMENLLSKDKSSTHSVIVRMLKCISRSLLIKLSLWGQI